MSKIINVTSGASITYNEEMIPYCLSKNILESITKHFAYQYYNKCIVTGLRIDIVIKTNMTKNIYTDEEFEKFNEANSVIPLFLFLLKSGKEISGKIYSLQQSMKNLFLNKQFNNNYILANKIEFIEYEENKHCCNGENKFNNLEGLYPSQVNINTLEHIISELVKLKSDNICLIHGGISGSFDLLCKQFITNHGDEVICHTLSYVPVLSSITTRGGVIKYIRPDIQNNKVNYYFNKISSHITSATKMIYLIHLT